MRDRNLTPLHRFSQAQDLGISGSRGSEHTVDRELMVEVEREIFGEANRVHGATPFVARCGAALKAVRSLSLDRNRVRVASVCDYERRWWWSALAIHSVM